jgi:hypothetical protein
MHCYHHRKLPISFAQLWATNAERNPERFLRNAQDYFIPHHRIETVKECRYIASLLHGMLKTMRNIIQTSSPILRT